MNVLDEGSVKAVKGLLRLSWTAIDFKWEGLTDVEKIEITPQQFEQLVKWAGLKVERPPEVNRVRCYMDVQLKPVSEKAKNMGRIKLLKFGGSMDPACRQEVSTLLRARGVNPTNYLTLGISERVQLILDESLATKRFVMEWSEDHIPEGWTVCP